MFDVLSVLRGGGGGCRRTAAPSADIIERTHIFSNKLNCRWFILIWMRRRWLTFFFVFNCSWFLRNKIKSKGPAMAICQRSNSLKLLYSFPLRAHHERMRLFTWKSHKTAYKQRFFSLNWSKGLKKIQMVWHMSGPELGWISCESDWVGSKGELTNLVFKMADKADKNSDLKRARQLKKVCLNCPTNNPTK